MTSLKQCVMWCCSCENWSFAYWSTITSIIFFILTWYPEGMDHQTWTCLLHQTWKNPLSRLLPFSRHWRHNWDLLWTENRRMNWHFRCWTWPEVWIGFLTCHPHTHLLPLSGARSTGSQCSWKEHWEVKNNLLFKLILKHSQELKSCLVFWAKIHQALLSQFSKLAEFFILKVPVKTKIANC